MAPVPLPFGASSSEGESDFARLNRNLNELLQELRISEVGAQILFAFLIGLPFTSGFSHVTKAEKAVYGVTLLLAVLSAALLISPAAYHRIVFRHHRRAELVGYASHILLGALTMLSLAMSGAIVLVTSFLFGSIFAGIAGGGVALWIGFFWYVLPLRVRIRFQREDALHMRLRQHLHPHMPHIHHHDHQGYAGHEAIEGQEHHGHHHPEHVRHGHQADHAEHAEHAEHADHPDHLGQAGQAGRAGGQPAPAAEDAASEGADEHGSSPDQPPAGA
jgi:hypothetical protein